MNKRFLLILSAVLLVFSSCARANEPQNDSGADTEACIDVYTDVLNEYGSRALSQTAVFRATVEGAPEGTQIDYTAKLTQTETDYSVSDSGGQIILADKELNGAVIKAACYIPPCKEDIQGEYENGMTRFSSELIPDEHRDELLRCSAFFDGYAALPEDSLSLSNIKYVAYSSDNILQKYFYSYDINISDDGAAFIFHITVETSII